MIGNYLYFSWQYLKRNRLFTLLNVTGLVIGITGALFIFLYVSFETSFERFHTDYQDIYRVIGIDQALGVSNNNVGITMPPLGPAMQETMPEVLQSVRIRTQGTGLVTVEDRNYYTEHLAFTTDAFFKVFNYRILQRQSEVLLDQPHAAVLTQSFAHTLFGDANPLGKNFRFNNQDVQVTGVMQDSRPDSIMKFDLLIGLNYLGPDEQGATQLNNFLNAWGNIAMVTYVKLAPHASETAVETKLTELMKQRSVMKTFSATLQPLQDAHLHSSDILFDDFNNNKGDNQKVLMLGSVGVFLLLIAAINFMNLSTARATLRAREVGVHKVAGASRGQLIWRFLQESWLLVIVAAVLAVALVALLQPLVVLSVDTGFVNYLFQHGVLLVWALVALAGLGLLSGSYPAFVLSAFSPVTVLKGGLVTTGQGLWLRRVLVVVQFSLSIAIIIAMLVVFRQLDYMKKRDPGFERDGIVNITLNDQSLLGSYESLKNRMLQLPQVKSVATSSNMPGQTFSRNGVRLPGTDASAFYILSAIAIDSAWLDTLQMSLVAGRNYSADHPADPMESVMLNESAVKALGWDTAMAVGKTLLMGNAQRTVIGVVKDFNFADMRHTIEPVMLLNREGAGRVISIRIDKSAPRAAVDGIAAAWKQINANHPFSYSFFTEEYNKLFRDDENFSAMLYQFTFIAILIACLGLYGLASFTTEQKTKEIGIRKVLGAGTASLLQLVLKEYGLLLLVANLLAWGAAWVVMNRWLSGFVYHTPLSPAPFVLATVGTTVLALATVVREIVKVIRSRPVEALRYE